MAPPPRPRQQLVPLRRHLFRLLLVAAAAAVFSVVPAAAAAQERYCRDSLAELKECEGFMYSGAAAPSPACCAAYEAAFDADPFCLCYVADGTYGRAAGYDVDVARALQVPAACGQAQPPIELCNMEGLVLPPYAPEGTLPAQPPVAADAPNAQPPSASESLSLPVAPPTFTSPPPPSSSGAPDLRLEHVIILACALVILNLI